MPIGGSTSTIHVQNSQSPPHRDDRAAGVVGGVLHPEHIAPVHLSNFGRSLLALCIAMSRVRQIVLCYTGCCTQLDPRALCSCYAPHLCFALPGAGLEQAVLTALHAC